MHLIKIKKGQDRKINAGHPWVYSNEIEPSPSLAEIGSGALVKVVNCFGNFLGTGYYNRHSLIAVRILSRTENQEINQNFLVKKIQSALEVRQKFFPQSYYRLIHSEADGLPGLIIDRFDNLLVLQIATAGMENLLELLIAALNTIFTDAIIALRNDIPARKLEGLEEYVKIVQSELPEKNILIENGLKFYFDPIAGQKTGWFFDQAQNRKFISTLAKDADILDCYCYNGGFGINAAAAEAKSVTFVDSSDLAISNVQKNIALNNLNGDCKFINGKVFDELENLIQAGKKFQVVVLDPPAFIKSKKDFFTGIKGYEKLTKIAAKLVTKGGYLFIASCSHNAGLQDLIKATATGIEKAGKNAKIIRIFGAGFDHPLHPFLPESEYLKSITYQIS
ncbi:MAG: SAM-dependent methyltransferase [Rickettsiaceae bacterium]|jgi:23S rRNA (cytosine1962-C5)-methyltransferase|nr:SAM-dependent methyltransferase [Rickettsiaceae bacterium]